MNGAQVSGPLDGALAAAVTPLSSGGECIDEDAIPPYLGFLAAAGLTGVLALGTTGEGALLTTSERMHAAEIFLAARGPLRLAINCGAQTTRDTALLAGHAAEIGADAVVVMGPPLYPLDAKELLDHFRTATAACAPLPFYVYEFAARTGYSVPLSVIEQLRESTSNLRGLKVSNREWDDVRPYALTGLDVFVGSEPLISTAMAAGARGAISGVAAAFPEEVARVVSDGSLENQSRVTALRAALNRYPFQAAVKKVLGLRGLPVRQDVRAPLRELTPDEVRQLERLLADSGAASSRH